MRLSLSLSLAMVTLTLTAAALSPPRAQACGGFFCSQSPVDQSAERVIFAVNDDGSTDMIVQIAYTGSSDDFAWLLPLAKVPDAESLDTFPDQAILSLDNGTQPTFRMHPDCLGWGVAEAASGGAGRGGAVPSAVADEDGVSVYIREVVGPYDVAVIGSDDAQATYEWLQENGYRITAAMNEYIKLYTEEGMKFLALKLTDEADVSEISPFRLRLHGDSPSIPLRLTSIAAMPEMGILVWVFGNQRFEPAGVAREIEIDDDKLRWGGNWPEWTNWKKLVAEAVDAVEGKGWVVEQAGGTGDLAEAVRAQQLDPSDPRYEAQQALSALLEGRPYMTRLYTRLSPEEMSYDPIFKRSDKDDVPAERQLPYVAELCDDDWENDPPPDPCDFNPCGARGLCRAVEDADGNKSAACACGPGFTARGVPGDALAVACIDERMSFLNPGDADAAGTKLGDPCVGYDCGEHGQCVSMNMTPTCECEQGYVASPTRGSATSLTCVQPDKAIPLTFYKQRRPTTDLPTGRDVHIVEVKSAGGCHVGSGTGGSWGMLYAAGLIGLWRAWRRRRPIN